MAPNLKSIFHFSIRCKKPFFADFENGEAMGSTKNNLKKLPEGPLKQKVEHMKEFFGRKKLDFLMIKMKFMITKIWSHFSDTVSHEIDLWSMSFTETIRQRGR